jgi:hypothetical protein
MGDSILLSFDLLAVTMTVCRLLSDSLNELTWLEARIGIDRNKKRQNLK